MPPASRPTVRVRTVPPSLVYDLRGRVLRTGQPPAASVWPGDDQARHFAAFAEDERVVGIVSFYRQPWRQSPERPALQLRGMATDPSVRGSGVGRALLVAAFDALRDEPGGDLVWCNARASALGFYERMGFQLVGEPYLVPGVDEPHRAGVWRR